MRPEAPWSIVDIDIAKGITEETSLALACDQPVFAILRRHGAVLGVRGLTPDERPSSAAEWSHLVSESAAEALSAIAVLGTGESRLGDPAPFDVDLALSGEVLEVADAALAARRARPINASAVIAICTRRRAADLRECLDACWRAAPGVGIIVVDNGPDVETWKAAKAAGATYVEAPKPGLSRARNAALAAAGEDVVIFVDDDVRPELGFVDALLRRFDEENVAVVCGLVLPSELETDAQVAFQFDLGFGGMNFLPMVIDPGHIVERRDSLPVWEIGAGAVMAVRRATALDLGGFDQRLGPGAVGGCGDDSEFWRRAVEHGRRLRYEPLAVVRHRHRRSWEELRAQAHGYAFGHVAALYVSWGRHRRVSDLARIFITLPKWYMRRLAKLPLGWAKNRPDRMFLGSLHGWIRGAASFRLARRLHEDA